MTDYAKGSIGQTGNGAVDKMREHVRQPSNDKRGRPAFLDNMLMRK